MKTSNLDRELRTRIDAFVNELSSLVKLSTLEAVHEALGSTLNSALNSASGSAKGAANSAASAVAAPAKRGPGRPPKAAGRRKGGKRTPEEVIAMADRVLAFIKSNPGKRLEEIGVATGIPTKEMKLPIQKLFDRKAIVTKGVKRGTKYFVK